MDQRSGRTEGVSMTPVILGILVLLVVAYLVWRFWLVSADRNESAESTTTEQLSSDGMDPLTLTEATGTVLQATAEHTWHHGHYLGKACNLAYLDETQAVPQFLEQLNLHAKLVSVDNTQAYVAENARSIVVAFRGSQSPTSLDGFKDWLLTNARNFLVLPEGRIGTDFAAAGVGARFHRGFMEALAEIWDPLLATVEQAIQRKERPLWITGHSLGGAVALLAAWRFHQQFIRVHRICTFGAPMVGNNAAAEAYHREFPNKIIRYVDYSDMVPKLPTISLLSNEYDHVQREIVVGQDSEQSANQLIAKAVQHTPDGQVNEAVVDDLWGNLHSGIAAHLMGNYILRLSEQLT